MASQVTGSHPIFFPFLSQNIFGLSFFPSDFFGSVFFRFFIYDYLKIGTYGNNSQTFTVEMENQIKLSLQEKEQEKEHLLKGKNKRLTFPVS